MPLSEKTRKKIISLVGHDGLNRILDAQERANNDSEVIKTMGVNYKSRKAYTEADIEASGFSLRQLSYIKMHFGDEGVIRAVKAGSREKGLAELAKLATAKTGSKTKTQSHTNTIRITPSDTGHAIVYKGQTIVDDANRLPGSSPSAIEARTPIIEDITERLQWYADQLGINAQLHYYFQQLLGGVDPTEDLYRLALSNLTNPYTPTGKARRKALSAAEEDELNTQRLEAMGVPESVILALGTFLKAGRYPEFIKRLMGVITLDGQTKSKAPADTNTAINPFFQVRVKI